MALNNLRKSKKDLSKVPAQEHNLSEKVLHLILLSKFRRQSVYRKKRKEINIIVKPIYSSLRLESKKYYFIYDTL